jgi:hypothetical protein
MRMSVVGWVDGDLIKKVLVTWCIRSKEKVTTARALRVLFRKLLATGLALVEGAKSFCRLS